MVDCYIWYSEKETGRGRSPPRPLLAVSNVTSHPLTASVPITAICCSAVLMCPLRVNSLYILERPDSDPLVCNNIQCEVWYEKQIRRRRLLGIGQNTSSAVAAAAAGGVCVWTAAVSTDEHLAELTFGIPQLLFSRSRPACSGAARNHEFSACIVGYCCWVFVYPAVSVLVAH